MKHVEEYYRNSIIRRKSSMCSIALNDSNKCSYIVDLRSHHVTCEGCFCTPMKTVMPRFHCVILFG